MNKGPAVVFGLPHGFTGITDDVPNHVRLREDTGRDRPVGCRELQEVDFGFGARLADRDQALETAVSV